MTMDRRTFLTRSGALAVVAAGGRFGVDLLSPFADVAGATANAHASLPPGTPIVILIDLQGGNDAANMLISPNDPWYYDQNQGHGGVAIPEDQLLALPGTSYALHPSLSWTASR